MKKQTISIIVAILVITSIVTTLYSRGQAVVVGPGNGKNTKVYDLEDMYSVLSYLIDSEACTIDTIENNRNVTLSLDDSVQIDETAKPIQTQTHTGATVSVRSALTSYQEIREITEGTGDKYSYNSEPIYKNIGYSSVDCNRDLTIYITQDATYYVSSGKVNASTSKYNTVTKDTYMQFDMQVCLDQNQESAYMNIKTLKMCLDSVDEDGKKSREEISIKEEYIGKWIQLPREAALVIMSLVDQYDRNYLPAIQMLIEEQITGNNESGLHFVQKDQEYSLSEDITNAENTVIGATKFLINLSDSSSPYVGARVSSKDGMDRYTVIQDLTFTNIDNTSIKGKITPACIIADEDDMDQVMNHIEE